MTLFFPKKCAKQTRYSRSIQERIRVVLSTLLHVPLCLFVPLYARFSELNTISCVLWSEICTKASGGLRFLLQHTESPKVTFGYVHVLPV